MSLIDTSVKERRNLVMIFLSLSFPSRFLNLADQASSREGQRLMTVMEHAFLDAVASLSLYQAARANLAASHRRTAAASSGACPTCGAQSMPAYLERHLPFVHAHSFLYALDTIRKVLTVLSQNPSFPDAVRHMGNKKRAKPSAATRIISLRREIVWKRNRG